MAVGMVDARVVGQLLPRHAIRLGAGILGGTSMATIGAAAPLFLIRLRGQGARARANTPIGLTMAWRALRLDCLQLYRPASSALRS